MERETAAAQLDDLAARRGDLAGRLPRRSMRRTVAMAVLLGAGIGLGALHNAVLTVLTVPFILYALGDLAGADGRLRAGVLPRRPRPFLALLLAAIAAWPAAVLLDLFGLHWALLVAAVVAPLLAIGAWAWLARARR